MAASSETGTGIGSALKAGQKGAEDQFLGTEKLIGPHIVLTGQTTLSSGAATVVFPYTLPGVAADYFVFCGGTAAISSASSITTTGFTLAGTGSQIVNWIVVNNFTSTVTPSMTPGLI